MLEAPEKHGLGRIDPSPEERGILPTTEPTSSPADQRSMSPWTLVFLTGLLLVLPWYLLSATARWPPADAMPEIQGPLRPSTGP